MLFGAFFKRKPTPAPDETLAARVSALEEQWKVIEDEWTDWYEKFRLLHLRLAKRQKALESAEAAESPTPPVQVPDLPNGGTLRAGLDQRQQTLQQDILRKRARL